MNNNKKVSEWLTDGGIMGTAEDHATNYQRRLIYTSTILLYFVDGTYKGYLDISTEPPISQLTSQAKSV